MRLQHFFICFNCQRFGKNRVRNCVCFSNRFGVPRKFLGLFFVGIILSSLFGPTSRFDRPPPLLFVFFSGHFSTNLKKLQFADADAAFIILPIIIIYLICISVNGFILVLIPSWSRAFLSVQYLIILIMPPSANCILNIIS